MLTPEQLAAEVKAGGIDTVVVAMVDVQGRLVGKRTDAEYFLEHSDHGFDHCNSLLTLDMESEPTQGFAFSSIDQGYGDLVLQPDLATLALMSWHEATAIVICDPVMPDGASVEVSPRTILKRQVERCRALGFEPLIASEVEFYLCQESYQDAWADGYTQLTPAARYVTDSHLLSPGFDESLIGSLRRHMRAAGMPVQASKGESCAGQHEINFRPADPVTVADRHSVYKHGAKEIVERTGRSITFMAKPDPSWMGNSCHVHQSLWRDGANSFAGESDILKRFLAGQLACISELAIFVAPAINSYKRFAGGESWAGNTVTWAHDNRTTGFRVAGHGDSQRVEARIPGADCNPYVAFAALLAAGMHGLEHELERPPPYEGNAYAATGLEPFPATLREAIGRLEQGSMARAAFGDEVVEHYLHFSRTEQRLFDQVVTDYERQRMFERG
jgi:glutamine synthetase